MAFTDPVKYYISDTTDATLYLTDPDPGKYYISDATDTTLCLKMLGLLTWSKVAVTYDFGIQV